MAEEKAVSLSSIAESQQIPAKEFEKQYKEHLSDYRDWGQKDHAEKWLVFEKNIGSHLSLDEVAISNGELYTVLTNKAAKGKQGSMVALREGTKSKDITTVFLKIPLKERQNVKEVTADFSPSMNLSIRKTFPNTKIVTDRFHVQKLVTEALQQIRITLRWQAIKEENEEVKKARKQNKKYQPKI